MADDAIEGRLRAFKNGEEAVLDREEELVDDAKCKIVEEEIEIAEMGLLRKFSMGMTTQSVKPSSSVAKSASM